MARLEVNQVKTKTLTGKWYSIKVKYIEVLQGKIYFINEVGHKVCSNNCLIIK